MSIRQSQRKNIDENTSNLIYNSVGKHCECLACNITNENKGKTILSNVTEIRVCKICNKR